MSENDESTDQVAVMTRGEGRVVATAVHDGHAVRSELRDRFAIGEAGRLQEEDPFTGLWTEVAATRLVATRSRFEFDINRPRESAIYKVPADAWGLNVWSSPLPEDVVLRSLAAYDRFYREARSLFDEKQKRFDAFVVLDLHTYNHRRDGPDGEPADPAANPEVNLGTGWIDRAYWAPVIERFIRELKGHAVMGHTLDVRENVKFKGGAFPRWIDDTYPRVACPIAVEFKKTFMDEWTGRLDTDAHIAIKEALASTIEGLEEELSRMRAPGR